MGKLYSGGIVIPTAFRIDDFKTIADYQAVETIANLTDSTLPYQVEGYVTYVQQDKGLYYRNDVEWIKLGTADPTLQEVLENGSTAEISTDFSVVRLDNNGDPTVSFNLSLNNPSGLESVGNTLFVLNKNEDGEIYSGIEAKTDGLCLYGNIYDEDGNPIGQQNLQQTLDIGSTATITTPFSVTSNGFSLQGGAGGVISTNPTTGIDIAGNAGGVTLNGNNLGVTANGGSSGIQLNANSGKVQINGQAQGIELNTQGGNLLLKGNYTGSTISDIIISNGGTDTGFPGALYDQDYSEYYTLRSLVDKEYVDNAVAGAGGTQDLQSVTDVDNTTTNDVNVNKIGIYDPFNELHQIIYTVDGGVSFGDGVNPGNSYFSVQPDSLGFGGSSATRVVFRKDYLTAGRNYQLPNADGTLALQESTIPLTGTNAGQPVTGDIEFGDGAGIRPSTGLDLSFGRQNLGHIKVFGDNRAPKVYFGADYVNPEGLLYEADYSANYTNRSLVDKGYVDNRLTGLGTGTVTSVAATGSNGIIVSGSPITSSGTLSFSLGAITPTSVSTGTGNFSGDVQIPALPVNATSAVSKSYVDNQIAGLNFKYSARVASTANVSISSAPSTIDGVTLSSGDRVLLKNQTISSQNGIYVFNGTGNALTRSDDADTGAELSNKTIPVNEGTTNQDTWWTILQDTIILGTTNITFSQTAGAGTYAAGTGIVLTGNVFTIDDTYITTATQTALNAKQVTLVSGTNIKTVGGQSLLGAGDITEVQNSLTASTILAPSVSAVNTGLALKGNLSGGNSWSGTQTLAGSIRIATGGQIVNNNNVNAFMLDVGSAVVSGYIGRNLNDSLAALQIINSNSSSTGDIIQYQSNIGGTTATRAGVRKDGRAFGSDATAVNDYITLGQLSTSLKSGSFTQSGNGTSTSFTINHGLSGITSANKVFLTARSQGASNWQYVTLNSTQITIFYSVAPPSGTNNLAWDWQII